MNKIQKKIFYTEETQKSNKKECKNIIDENRDLNLNNISKIIYIFQFKSKNKYNTEIANKFIIILKKI